MQDEVNQEEREQDEVDEICRVLIVVQCIHIL